MNLFYKLAYWIGFAPWEHAAVHPPAVKQITALFEREESERKPPYGRALDLGCGRGCWSVELARRGWTVCGVELVSKAVDAARAYAREANADVQIVQGDITRFRDAGVGSEFELVWDFGTVHGLNRAQRLAVGREVSAVAGDNATILMLAWEPGHRGPLPRGVNRREIEEAFAGWIITDVEPFDSTGLPRFLSNVNPHIYRLRRV